MIGEDALTILRRGWRNQSPFGLFRPLYASVTFVEDRLELGAGAVLARMARGDLGETVLVFEGGEERTLALLTVAYLRPVQARALAHLRRGARDWARGEKCLAHLHLAFGGLSKLDEPEEAAFRIFVADNLLKARVPARDLLKAFGLDPGSTGALEKYSPDQPRVPQGSGRPSGQWTAGDFIIGAVTSMAVEAIDLVNWIKSHLSSKPLSYKPFHGWPKNAVAVTRSGNGVVEDSSSPTGALVAPQQADYYQIYAAGEAVSRLFLPNLQAPIINSSIGHGGAYDFQRDSAAMAFIPAYTNASNYSVGVYMAGAAYSEEATVLISESFALIASSNYGSKDQIGWIKRGWEDAHAGYWDRD